MAWRLADDFKQAVFALLREHPALGREYKFKSQLIESSRGPAKCICEGFARRSPPTFVVFLGYALGSLAEAEERLIDAVQLGYLTADSVAPALLLAKRCSVATSRLRRSQIGRPAPAPPPPGPDILESVVEPTSCDRSRPPTNRNARTRRT